MGNKRRPSTLALASIVLSTVLSLIVLACAIEVWVRFSWNPLKGTPGFFISSPTRIEQLAANYSGYFTGVPVRINNLGFRDQREYKLDKNPATFRILFLGDSVTFGHGSLYESTYPRLFESKLKAWQPDIDWQIWNLGVPGYNTSQELAYLQAVGALYQPDLVIIGFKENDVIGNWHIESATVFQIYVSQVKNFLKTHFYSFHFYKKVYLQFYSAVLASDVHRQLLRNLAREESLLSRVDQIQNLDEQRVGHVERLVVQDIKECECQDNYAIALIKEGQNSQAWYDAVRSFQQLQKRGIYQIVFFINIAPDTCDSVDLFCHGPHKHLNDWLIEVLSDETSVISSYDAFYSYRPSQMPLAGGHSLGNSNNIKADTLFQYLKSQGFFERLGKRKIELK